MIGRLGLLSTRNSLSILARGKQARKLYTVGIYPYPNYYAQTVLFPSRLLYRETYEDPPYKDYEVKMAKRLMTIFWAWFFYQLFDDPGVILGHFHPPDPSKWTDEELGIPPLEVGSYEEWLVNKTKQAE